MKILISYIFLFGNALPTINKNIFFLNNIHSDLNEKTKFLKCD